jgi:putative endonuclease
MNYGGTVYIMTNKRNGTLYVGVTSNLQQRILQHRTKALPNSFTAKYNCNILVYYRNFPRIEDAIAEEKRIKGSNRTAKLQLIESMNPQWNDLWKEIEKW